MTIMSFAQRCVRVLRGEVSTEKLVKRGLKVGKQFNRMGGCIIDPPHCFLIEIGDQVTLASRVYILAHDASTKMHLGYGKVSKVKIGNKVFIGANTTVLPGVTIGNDVIIGSGSVVTKDIPSGTVAAGNPAKVITDIKSYLDKNKSQLETSNNIYDASWRINNISPDKKKKMILDLEDEIGFLE